MKIFLQMALPTPLRRLFDYLPPQDIDLTRLIPGVRIRVPFQSRILTGILTGTSEVSSVPPNKLKAAFEVLDEQPILPADIYQLCHWAADYYHYALGEVLAGALPSLLRKGKDVTSKIKREACAEESETPLLMNAEQQHAVDTISLATAQFQPFLLDGVTGSGKTEVYLQAIQKMLALNKQVLVLVPEISLTPQTIARFRARFAVPIVALHSSLSERERLHGWLRAQSGEAKIVIGTRSAVFTPFANLGLIIVDEEHDASFKQQDRFRYHARDLAIMRASINRIPIVLGSATPSLESLLNVKRQRYAYLSLPERAGVATMPAFELVDLRQSKPEQGLSPLLLQRMREHLEQENQVMLFLNRRGFAPVFYCTQCAAMVECKRCDARMVYHRTPPRLQCHHCDTRMVIREHCAKCGARSMQPVGLGTQRLEETLAQYFPEIPIIRVDRDSTSRKGAMQTLLAQIHAEKKAILLGTQMLAKGHHFPDVTLVGVIDADSGLFSTDFRAAEQMGQLLLQVAGRAGRAEKPGKVVIQTFHPEHPLLQTLLQQGYHHFATTLLSEREQTNLPPYTYFALLRAEAYNAKHAANFLNAVKNACVTTADSITMIGPLPALMAKRKGLHCEHLLVRANRRQLLQLFLKEMVVQIEKLAASHTVKWILDVDPFEV